jgi:hypothetical protein
VRAKINPAEYRQAYELEVGGIEFFFVAETTDFSFIQRIQKGYVAHPALYSNDIFRFVARNTATGA